MYVYDKRQRLQRHYAEGRIFDSITNVASKIAGNASMRNATMELGKTALAIAGNAASEKIANAIRKKRLTAKNQTVLKILSQPLNDVKRQDILKTLSQLLDNAKKENILSALSRGQNPIANVLEGSGQAIAY